MERGSEIRGTSRTGLASKGQVPPRLRRNAHSLQLCRTHSSSVALRTQPGARDTSRSCSFWSAREQHPEKRTNGEGEASLQVTWGQQLLMRQSVLSFFLNFIYVFMAALGLRCYTWAFSSCGCSSCGVWASHCSGFSCCRARASVVAACEL